MLTVGSAKVKVLTESLNSWWCLMMLNQYYQDNEKYKEQVAKNGQKTTRCNSLDHFFVALFLINDINHLFKMFFYSSHHPKTRHVVT